MHPRFISNRNRLILETSHSHRKIINHFSAKFNGKEVFSTILYPSVSANPYLAFKFKVPGSGEMEFSWTEDGGAVTSAKKKVTAA